jgi:hypothetical protein
MKEGSRVGAIRNEEDGKVYFFGYGTYLGRAPCPILYDIPNPKIQLDDGTIVWGCESWWGAEELIKARLAGREVVVVPPRRAEGNVNEP